MTFGSSVPTWPRSCTIQSWLRGASPKVMEREALIELVKDYSSNSRMTMCACLVLAGLSFAK